MRGEGEGLLRLAFWGGGGGVGGGWVVRGMLPGFALKYSNPGYSAAFIL